MSVLLQLKLDDLERKINNAPKDYEYRSLVSRVDCLEHSLREARTTIDELRYQLERHEESIRSIEAKPWEES